MSIVKLDRGPGNLPVYQQISEALKRDIQHDYKAGDALPSESALSSNYRVNRHTLRRAIDVLVRDGIVVRYQGKGMFVQAPRIEYPIASRTRLTETLEAQGLNSISRIVNRGLTPAKSDIAELLGVQEGDPLIFMEALRITDHTPFCVGSHLIPYSMFPAVLDKYRGGSLHGFLEERYHAQLSRKQSMITAAIPEKEDLELLNLPPQAPVLHVRSLNVVEKTGQPAEYVITRFRGDIAEIVVQPE